MATKDSAIGDAFAILFSHFNEHLFYCELKPCIVGFLHSNQDANGQFATAESFFPKLPSDVIFIRMQLFAIEREAYSTFVHEMVHAWQYRHGRYPDVSGFNNNEWSGKMESVGLMPSDRKEPGGERTGPSVSHYVIVGGQFDESCKQIEGKFKWNELLLIERTKNTGKTDG